MRILALDVGDVRIGVALSDPTELLASPLTIIKRLNDASDLQAVGKLVQEHQAGRVVMGLPLTLSGDVGVQAEKVQAFAEKLRSALPVPVEMIDERFSTVTAKEYMRETAKKKDRFKKKHDDDVAAAVILQGYLDEAALRRG